MTAKKKPKQKQLPQDKDTKRVVSDIAASDYEKFIYICAKKDSDAAKMIRKYVKAVIAKYKEENPSASIFKNDQ